MRFSPDLRQGRGRADIPVCPSCSRDIPVPSFHRWDRHSCLSLRRKDIPVLSIFHSVCLGVVFLFSVTACAELPLARLSSIFPLGGQQGGKVEVTLSGQDLDGVNRLWFSHSGIAAVRVPSNGNSAAKFLITVDSSVPPGLYDVRAVGLFGVSNPRTFEVRHGGVIANKGGNTRADIAMEVPFGTVIDGIAEVNADQYYRVEIRGRKRLTVDVATTALDSKMEPVVLVADASGRELGRSRRAGEPIELDSPADGRYLISIHDVLYRGGPEFFYSLHVSDEAAQQPPIGSVRWAVPPATAFLDDPILNAAQCRGTCTDVSQATATERQVQPPCDIVAQFRTARQRDGYTFDAPAGAVYWIEIISHRLGQDTSPFFLVQRVDRDGKGGEKQVDMQEAYAPAPPAAVPEFPIGTRDPIYRLEVKEAGRYRLLVRDLFSRERGDHPAVYHLVIRRESPGFDLVALPPSPLPEPPESKDVPVWTTLLRRGGTAAVKVIAVRCDGFTGPIRLHVDGLPLDIAAGPAIIPEGASTATIVLRAAEDARSWVGPMRITGVGQTSAGELRRVARAGTVSFSTYDVEKKTLLLLRSRLTDQFVVGVSSVEASPISVTPTQDTFEAPAGGKIAVSFSVKSRSEFTSPIVLNLAGHALAVKQLAVDPKAEKATAELDLSQTKLPPGRYTLHFVGQAKLKYADNPDLRAARIAQISAENHEDEVAAELAPAASAIGAAVQSKDLKLAMNRTKAFLRAERNWMKAGQLLTAADTRAAEVAAHAPAAERTISIYTGAFELNVLPAVAK